MTDRLDNLGTPMINPDGTVMSFQEATDALNAGKKDPNKVPGGIPSMDPNKKDPDKEPRDYISILDELVSLVNENPRYTGGEWDMRDTLVRLIAFGLRLEDSQINDKPIPPVIGHAPLG